MSHLVYSVYSNHWDPKLFPEPAKFDPERFLEREEDKKVAHAFIPFGGGARMCLGMGKSISNSFSDVQNWLSWN